MKLLQHLDLKELTTWARENKLSFKIMLQRFKEAKKVLDNEYIICTFCADSEIKEKAYKGLCRICSSQHYN